MHWARRKMLERLRAEKAAAREASLPKRTDAARHYRTVKPKLVKVHTSSEVSEGVLLGVSSHTLPTQVWVSGVNSGGVALVTLRVHRPTSMREITEIDATFYRDNKEQLDHLIESLQAARKLLEG